MKSILALVFALFLQGCATVTPADYATEKPKLDLASYFNGKVDGWAWRRTAPARSCGAWSWRSIASG